MKSIHTSNGNFLIKDLPSLDLVHNDELNNYLFSLKKMRLYHATNEEIQSFMGDEVKTIDYLIYLLKSKGIEICYNTYIFKV